MAGFPVYSVPGRNGGWRLLGSARSGLTTGEAAALFLAARSQSGLGHPAGSAVSVQLGQALRKLLHALPDPVRRAAEAAARSVVVDDTSWTARSSHAPGDPPPFLQAVQDAVLAGDQVLIGYTSGEGCRSRRSVDPLGLVAKGTRWYLVAQGSSGLRTFRIDRITGLEPSGAKATRTDGFDLVRVWEELKAEFQSRFTSVEATALVAPGSIEFCQWKLGRSLTVHRVAPDGRIEVGIDCPSPRAVACQVAGLGGQVEVVSPPTVRSELSRIAADLQSLYSTDPEFCTGSDPAVPVRSVDSHQTALEWAAAAPSPAGWTGGMQHASPQRRKAAPGHTPGGSPEVLGSG